MEWWSSMSGLLFFPKMRKLVFQLFTLLGNSLFEGFGPSLTIFGSPITLHKVMSFSETPPANSSSPFWENSQLCGSSRRNSLCSFWGGQRSNALRQLRSFLFPSNNPPFSWWFCRACRNEKSPITVSYSNRAMYGGFSSGKTKTPGRKNFLLSVIHTDKTGLEMSGSVRIRQTFLFRNMRSFG